MLSWDASFDLILYPVPFQDLYSYKHEFIHENAEYNAVAVVMSQLTADLPTAVQWVSDLHDEIVDRFLKTQEDVLAHRKGAASWGAEMDRAVRIYIDGIGELLFPIHFTISCLRSSEGQWLRGVDEWHFRSERYVCWAPTIIQY